MYTLTTQCFEEKYIASYVVEYSSENLIRQDDTLSRHESGVSPLTYPDRDLPGGALHHGGKDENILGHGKRLPLASHGGGAAAVHGVAERLGVLLAQVGTCERRPFFSRHLHSVWRRRAVLVLGIDHILTLSPLKTRVVFWESNGVSRIRAGPPAHTPRPPQPLRSQQDRKRARYPPAEVRPLSVGRLHCSCLPP